MVMLVGAVIAGCAARTASTPPPENVAAPSAPPTPAPATKPDPQASADLARCLDATSEKDKLIAALGDENARLMRASASQDEISVAIEGPALVVKANGAPGKARPKDDAIAAASRQFLDTLGASRDAIQKCYQRALSTNPTLQARVVTLTVSASFATSGQLKSASSAPSLGDAFDACIQTVAKLWHVPTTTAATTFKAQITLTP